jgi:hypothetical protein
MQDKILRMWVQQHTISVIVPVKILSNTKKPAQPNPQTSFHPAI